MLHCAVQMVGNVFVFSCALLLATQLGCQPTNPTGGNTNESENPDVNGDPPTPLPPTTGIGIDSDGNARIHPFSGIDPSVSFDTPSSAKWHVLAGSLDLTGFGSAPVLVTAKSFEGLTAGNQAALTATLDAARSGPPQSIFLPQSILQPEPDSNGVLAMGIGFTLQSSPANWHAFGFPALRLTEDPYMPMAVAPDSPVVALRRDTFDKLQLAFEPVVASLTTGGLQSTDPAIAAELSRLAEDLESFLSGITSDDPTDGRISAQQQFSFTMPGAMEYEVPDQELVADVTFDLEQTASGDRWVGGLGTDVTVTDLTTGEVTQQFAFEVGYGQQEVADIEVIRLEPGDGTADDASHLAGVWLASVAIPDLLTEAELIPASTAQPGMWMKSGSVAGGSPTMNTRMQHATSLLLSTIAGAGIRDPRAQAIPAEGDTLFVQLSFSELGRWTDMSFAIGTSDHSPETLEFNSLVSVLGLLQAQLAVELPPVELRTTMDSGYVRLDVVATDLVEVLLASLGPASGLDELTDVQFGELPDISVLVIGGRLSGDAIDGSAVILVLAADVRFQRQ